jgi:DNA-directed RNA polymerase specialized sigma subunit
MKVLSASFRGETVTITTTDEFDALDTLERLDILKYVSHDMETIYRNALRAWRTHMALSRPSRRHEIHRQAQERAMQAFNYRNEGKTFREVGECMEVSASRAQQLVHKAERILKRKLEHRE